MSGSRIFDVSVDAVVGRFCDHRRLGYVCNRFRCLAAKWLSSVRSGLIELFRLAIVIAAVAFLFNQPEYIEEIRPEERPTIAVLWDDSPSMETRDVVRTLTRPRPSPNHGARPPAQSYRSRKCGAPLTREDDRRDPAFF